ncbi:peptidase T [Bacillus sp. NRRL B-14911]|nr:peptidase T [Bacillus sp. NRRL B-14911]
MAKNRFVTSQPIQSPFFKKHGAKVLLLCLFLFASRNKNDMMKEKS